VDDEKRVTMLNTVTPADRTYVVLFSARSGSTWLTAALTETKRLGHPEEYLNPDFVQEVAKSMYSKTPEEFFEVLLRKKKTPNGVCGMEARHVDIELIGKEVFSKFFSQGVFFHLWRENIIAQAISLYKAVASNRYHSISGPATEAPEYDADKILSWLRHIANTENNNVKLLRELNLPARHLRYEDIVRDRVQTVRQFAHALGVPFTPGDFQQGIAQDLKKIGDAWNVEIEQRIRLDRPSEIAAFENARLVKNGFDGDKPFSIPPEPELHGPWRLGWDRGKLGRSPRLNPYEAAGPERDAWLDGWRYGWDDQPYTNPNPPPPPEPVPPRVPKALREPTPIALANFPAERLRIDPATTLRIEPGRFAPASSLTVSGQHNAMHIGADFAGALRVMITANSSTLAIGARARVLNGQLVIVMHRGPSRLIIGEGTTFTGGARLIMHEATELHIGADCMVAGDVDVMTSDGYPIYDQDGARLNPAESITIGDHVWLCEGARILKGAHIGAGSVVALNAVVTAGTYPPNALLVGSPAKPVRQGIRWDRKLPA
jgi:LPS sulfotransferase NodH/acetyltransferase-like isoleucine patch superfamily enzyme/ribosome modulation factor